jgi:hypothetical protein
MKEFSGVVSHLKRSKYDFFFKINIYFTSVVQQPYGYNVTGQLQEPKDLIRPATAKVGKNQEKKQHYQNEDKRSEISLKISLSIFSVD